jgi:hypothetical protein
LNQERERKVIMLKEGTSNKWSYFTHCAALCVLVSVGICNAPLLHDYTVPLQGELGRHHSGLHRRRHPPPFLLDRDLVVFDHQADLDLQTESHGTSVINRREPCGTLDVLLVQVGRATVRQARSLKLVTDIDLMSSRVDDLSHQPLLIVGNGRTYNIAETSPKKAIMSVIQKATMNKKASNGSVSNQDDEEEQIYWLRPALVSPQSSPDEAKQLCWFKNKPKHKVTFNETTSTSVNR